MVDRTSGVPAFRQVAADLRGKITAGQYEPGARLPSERELVESYGVSRPTIPDAVNVLRSEGIVVAEHGRGVFVRRPSKIQRLARSRLSRQARQLDQGAFLADAAAAGFNPSSSVKIRFEPASERVALHLGVQPGAEVTVRDRVMRADGAIVQLAVSRFPRAFTRDTVLEQVDTGPGGTYARLEEAGHRIDSFTEHVGARMPEPQEASVLQLGPGVPVITVTRLAIADNGIPLEISDIVLPGDRYELSYQWPSE